MQVIKKYSNRKLYHTNQKQYITLDGIAQLVQSGEPIQVIDNESGAEITSGILAQIALQQRGQRDEGLPANFLTDLIQTGWRRSLFATLGGETLVDAEISRRLKVLVAAGHLTTQEGVRLQDLLTSSLAEADELLRNIPSQNDVARLHAQLDALNELVERMIADRTAAAQIR